MAEKTLKFFIFSEQTHQSTWKQYVTFYDQIFLTVPDNECLVINILFKAVVLVPIVLPAVRQFCLENAT